ncbi:3-deoxy-D-manno-octulosonic acid transferase [Litorimonas haliclonae]|uniref:3-deoxy-D-manno-octulosonic acid transferase n=1 Tax=Litorimonas haliclonae TaxID=2081977 RepID=UPI0039EE5708
MTARLYALLMRGLSLFLPLWLRRRARAGKEDARRLSERYGRTERKRPKGELIWMHGASVGETTMMLPLIRRLLETPGRSVLVTSGTVTSAELMAKKLPQRAFHQYAPFDAPQMVARFLAHWQPDLAVWAESEIWPNLVLQTHKAGIPMALINGRMGAHSIEGWAKREAFAKQVFGCFDQILPADAPTAQGLSQFVDAPLSSVGNLKYDAPTLSFDAAERGALKSHIGDRPVWVAASVHAEEMDVFIQAQKEIGKDALLVLVPRHPSDASSRMLLGAHPTLNFAQRSKRQKPSAKTDIYLCDTLGEMGLAYALGDVAVVGGSFSPELMGHNPLEPVRLSVPTLTGPHYTSFEEVYAPYLQSGAIKVVEDGGHLAQIVKTMFTDTHTATEMTKRASAIAAKMSGSLDITHRALEELL